MQVMIQDVLSRVKEADETAVRIQRMQVSLVEKSDRMVALQDNIIDEIFEKSRFRDISNGRRVFDCVWEAVQESVHTELYVDATLSFEEAYREFCERAKPYLEAVYIALGKEVR